MIYLFFFLMSFIMTFLIKNYAIKKSLVAEVSERSSHTVPTPHGGGIAVAFTWFVGLIYFYLNNQIESTLFFALMCGVIIAIVGFVDDIIELSAKSRMVIFSFVALIGLYILGGLQSITFVFFEITNPVITTVFAFIFILWYINLTNFIDGIDGYLATQFLFLSVAGLLFFGGVHFALLGVSVLGFLYWNWHKAKIFMGDVGSTLLGYTVAIFTLYYADIAAENLWVWIILYGLFWFDATVTLVRRKLNAELLSQAHKKHAYQRLTQAGWSHSRVTLYALVINFIILAFLYLIPNIAISFIFSLTLLTLAYVYVEKKKSFV